MSAFTRVCSTAVEKEVGIMAGIQRERFYQKKATKDQKIDKKLKARAGKPSRR